MGTSTTPRPLPKPVAPIGGAENSAEITSPPILANYPHDTFRAPETQLLTTSIVLPGMGTGGDGKEVRPVPERCSYEN